MVFAAACIRAVLGPESAELVLDTDDDAGE